MSPISTGLEIKNENNRMPEYKQIVQEANRCK
jgi:hypothetical protein